MEFALTEVPDGAFAALRARIAVIRALDDESLCPLVAVFPTSGSRAPPRTCSRTRAAHPPPHPRAPRARSRLPRSG